jgi:hypothetical protein
MLYILLAIAAIAVMLYFMPIVITLDVRKNGENDNIIVGINTLYGLLKLHSEIPFLKIVFENGRPGLKYKIEASDRKRSKLLARFTKIFTVGEGEGLYRMLKRGSHIIMRPLKYITSKTRISRFYLKLCFGTGDAAATGIIYGAAWIVIGNMLTFVNSFLKLNKPRIVIVPLFSGVQLAMDFNCIISIKFGHIIIAGIRAIPALISSKKQ